MRKKLFEALVSKLLRFGCDIKFKVPVLWENIFVNVWNNDGYYKSKIYKHIHMLNMMFVKVVPLCFRIICMLNRFHPVFIFWYLMQRWGLESLTADFRLDSSFETRQQPFSCNYCFLNLNVFMYFYFLLLVHIRWGNVWRAACPLPFAIMCNVTHALCLMCAYSHIKKCIDDGDTKPSRSCAFCH